MADLFGMLQAAAGNAGEDIDPNFNQTVLLLHGDGTNGAQNNTFLDSSTNNFTITRNGNTTQGTFSPFSLPDGRWANTFDGTSDYVETPSSSSFAFGTGAFTVEGFFYANRFPTSGNIFQILNFTDDAENISLNANGTISYFNGSVGTNSTATYSLGTWHHVALVRESTSSSGVKVYLDGVLIITATSSTNYSSNRTLVIGARAAATKGANCLDGYMSNVRVAKSAIYTGAFSEITEPLTTTSQSATNVELLTCQSNRFVDNSTNNFAITRNGDVKVTPFSPFAPTAAYDASVNGGSGYFDGTGDYFTLANSSDFSCSGNFTVQTFAYPVSFANTPVILDTRTTPGSSTAILFYFNTSGNVLALVGGTTITSSSTYSLNAWHHIGIVRSGTTVTIYVNGSADGSNASISANLNDTGMTIGAPIDQRGATTTNKFTGYLSNISFNNTTAIDFASTGIPTAPLTAVSGTSLLLNFTNAGIFDNTGKNNLETVGNAQIDTTTKKYGTGSIEFDGTGDRLVLPASVDFVFNADFTIEMWAYINTAATQAALITWGDGAFKALAYLGGAWRLEYPASSSVDLTGAFTKNQWVHYALTRSGSTVRWFIDGVLTSTNTISATIGTNEVVRIGNKANDTTDPDFNGYIDDLRITKGIARYTAAFTPPAAAFPNL